MKQKTIIELADFDIQCQNKEKLTVEELDNLKLSPHELLRAIKEKILTPVMGHASFNFTESKDICTAISILYEYMGTSLNKNAIIFFGQPSRTQLEDYSSIGSKTYGVIDYAHDQLILEYFDSPDCDFYEFGLDDSFISLAMTLIHGYEKLNPTVLKLMKSDARNTIYKDCGINDSLLKLSHNIRNARNCEVLEKFYLSSSLDKYINNLTGNVPNFKSSINYIPLIDSVFNIGLTTSSKVLSIHDIQLFMQKGDTFCTLNCDKIDILIQHHFGSFRLLALSKLGYDLIMLLFDNCTHQNGLMFKIHKDVDTMDKLLNIFNSQVNVFTIDPLNSEYSKKLGL